MLARDVSIEYNRYYHPQDKLCREKLPFTLLSRFR